MIIKKIRQREGHLEVTVDKKNYFVPMDDPSNPIRNKQDVKEFIRKKITQNANIEPILFAEIKELEGSDLLENGE